MAIATQQQIEYLTDVVLRQYCRAAEENEILYSENEDLKECLALLFQENAELRFKLKEVGIEVAGEPLSVEAIENLTD